MRRHHLPLGGLRFAFCSTSGIVRLVSCSGLSKGVALADGNNQLPQLSLSTLNYPASIWLYVDGSGYKGPDLAVTVALRTARPSCPTVHTAA
jgi:hypothetical protein